MCHICRKVEKLQALESNLIKPIYILLAKLHKYAEPHLGDLWLWRHDRTLELRDLLTVANSKILNPVLKSMADDVEKELTHIRCNMPLHPPQRSTGRWDALKTYIEPRESVSNNVSKSSQDELRRGGRTERRRREVGEGDGVGRSERKSGHGSMMKESRKVSEVSSNPPVREQLDDSRQSPPELSGSDLDPSSVVMEQSSRKVAEWLIKCNKTVNTKDDHNDDTNSLVSLVDGGLAERPDIDVKIWYRVRSLGMKSPGSRNRRSGSSSWKTYSKSSRTTTHLSDCIYDDPLHKLKLDERVVKKIDRIPSDKARLQFFNNLSSRLYLKMGQSLSRKKKIPVDKALRMIKADKRGERHVYMTGGRSEGRGTRVMPASTEALVGGEYDIGRSSFENGTRARFVLTRSEYGECVKRAAGGLASTSSIVSANSKSSSRDSVVNMGSVIRRSKHTRENVRVMPRDTACPRRPGDSTSEDSFTPTTPQPLHIKQASLSSKKTINVTQAREEETKFRNPVPTIPINTVRPRRPGDVSSESWFTPTAPQAVPISKKSSQQSPEKMDVHQVCEGQVKSRSPKRTMIRNTARPRRPGDVLSESSFTPTAPEPVPIGQSSQPSPQTTILRQAREDQLRREREDYAEKIAEGMTNLKVLRWKGRDYHEIERSKPKTVDMASAERGNRREDRRESGRQPVKDTIDAVRKRRVEKVVKTTQADKYKDEERQRYWHKK